MAFRQALAARFARFEPMAATRAMRVTLAVLALAFLPAGAAAQVERFAVVVGNDVGQSPDVPLRYAEVDATRVASVLQEVGGVRPENVVLLRGRDADTVRRALIAVNDRVRAAGRQTLLLVYYSGHADAAALHLGTTSLELVELEQLVRGSAASFRLLVLDACRSGALTRVKGGTPIPAFEIGVERMAGEGAVFLTSSSASEDSQEPVSLRAGRDLPLPDREHGHREVVVRAFLRAQGGARRRGAAVTSPPTRPSPAAR